MTKEIAELSSFLKKEVQASLRKEYLKSLENIGGCLLFCLELLEDHELEFLNEFLLNDFTYDIMQVSVIILF